MSHLKIWIRPENVEHENYKFRKTLPSEMSKKHENSQLWSLMKSNIGKDLSRTVMPIQLNEPISFLQRICESMENCYLIFQAAIETDPIIRMEMITAFVISAVSSSNNRPGKPFNPLLGETYELDRSTDRGFIFISEQVSHHPPISAFYAKSTDPNTNIFTFWGSLTPKVKFSGTSLEVRPKGNIYLNLEQHNETYVWQNPTYCVNNILLGKATIAYQGETTIRCKESNLQSTIKWKSSGVFFKGTDDAGSKNRVEAYINKETKASSWNGFVNKKKKEDDDDEDGIDGNDQKRVVYGRWSEAIYSVSEDVWKNRHKQKTSCQKNEKNNKNNVIESPLSGVVSKLGTGMRFFHHNSTQNISPIVSLEIPDPQTNGMGVSEHNENSSDIRKSYSPILDRKSRHHHHHQYSSTNSSPDLSDNEDDSDLHLSQQQCLWRRSLLPIESESIKYFNFSYFTMILNQPLSLTSSHSHNLPPTDSRFRPDIRMLEEGRMQEAESEKLRLENKQRARQKELKNQKGNSLDDDDTNSSEEQLKTAPLWFELKLSLINQENEWLFNEKYFERNWNKCLDIF